MNNEQIRMQCLEIASRSGVTRGEVVPLASELYAFAIGADKADTEETKETDPATDKGVHAQGEKTDPFKVYGATRFVVESTAQQCAATYLNNAAEGLRKAVAYANAIIPHPLNEAMLSLLDELRDLQVKHQKLMGSN